MTTARIHSMESSTSGRLSYGWVVFYLSAAFWAATLVFQFFLPLDQIYPQESLLLDVSEGFIDGFGFLCFTLVGAMLLARGNRLGRAYLLPGLAYNLGFLLMNYSLYGLHVSPLPAYIPMALSGNISFLISITVTLVVIPLLYPSGQPWSRLGKYLYRLAVATLAIGALGITFTPGPVNEPDFTAPNPLGIESARSALEAVMGIVLLTTVVLVLVAALSLIARIRRAEPGAKRPLVYFLVGEIALVFVFLSDSLIQPIFPIWGPIAPLIAIPAIPVATYLALLKSSSA